MTLLTILVSGLYETPTAATAVEAVLPGNGISNNGYGIDFKTFKPNCSLHVCTVFIKVDAAYHSALPTTYNRIILLR